MITTKDLYKRKIDCCGCEACANVCPKNIIRISPDPSDGFLYPEAFDPSQCIDCKRCLNVCPLKIPVENGAALYSLGARANDENTIRKSASGGIAFNLAQTFLASGGGVHAVVYGVEYAHDFKQAIFSRCSTIEDLDKYRGSKYVQARKGDIYKKIRQDIKEGKRILLVGLPCEIHAFKLVFKNYDQLYTVSLICHGPTSPLVQSEFIKQSSKPNSQIIDFTVRYKLKGWKPYYIRINYDDGSETLEKFHESDYGIAFKELKRPSCSECKFKLHLNSSSIDSDLIIGDYHGISSSSPIFNKWGASQISVMTSKGEELMKLINGSIESEKISNYQAIHYNKALGKIIKPRWNRNQYAKILTERGLEAASQLWSIGFIDKYQTLRGQIMMRLAKMRRWLINKIKH